MVKLSFNPVNFAVSLGVGWFVLSFLQSAVRSFSSGRWEGLVPRFKDIAFFHDGAAVVINLAVILVLWIVTAGLWYLAHQK
jgi:hypothetical protein